MPILHVALPVPKRQIFEYLSNDSAIEIGCRVSVSFGPRQIIGVVVDKAQTSQWPIEKLKPVNEVLDVKPVLDEHLLALCNWLSRYYQHPIGDVVTSALPVALRKAVSSELAPIKYWKAVDSTTVDVLLGRAKKQVSLYKKLLQGSQSHTWVLENYSQSIVKSLREKGLVEEELKRPDVKCDWQSNLSIQPHQKANVEQSLAITGLTSHSSSFHCSLLEGVTGSGKTEVYLQVIEPILRGGKQVLILVPEIGLTPQTVKRFAVRYGTEVGVLHSNLTDNERLAVWHNARLNQVGIVLGTRSAIFTPFANLGMIIVDEEHDGSYKQQDGLRYHARDLAVVRAKHADVSLILGTATPCFETLNNALAGKYQHFILSNRAGSAVPPQQHIVDVRNQPLQFGLSASTIKQMEQHLEQGSQVMLFVNRRGFAPAWLCHQCGEVEHCQRCERPYTIHKQLNRLHCHHCSATKPIRHKCTACEDGQMQAFGIGTEQLEEGLSQLFTQYKNVRIDSDSTRGKNKLQSLLQDINEDKYQLLIGTQILSKGHHFPNVTLVVIMDTDGALFSADYRAAEQLAQLITQLSGRAGRAEKPGELILQSHNPGHPLLQDLVHNGYGHFARQALEERRLANIPPFSSQALLRAESTSANRAFEFLQTASQRLTQYEGLIVIGPMPSMLEKRQDRYRLQVLIQATFRSQIQKVLAPLLPEMEILANKMKMRWSIDVDPQDFV